MCEKNTCYELQTWKFTLDQTQYGLSAGWATDGYDDSAWGDVQTCTAWETYEYAMQDYEGHGWFRTRYSGNKKPGRRHILHFEGVGGMAQVYVNGRFVGGTDNRYLPFDIDITLSLKEHGDSVIAVLVDNRYRGPEHLPGAKTTEWVLYGGLTHRVWVEEKPANFIADVRLDAEADGSFRAVVACENKDVGTMQHGFEGQLQLSVEGLPELTFSQNVTVAYKETVAITFEGKAENVKTWSPDSPNLYNVTVTLTGPDTYYEKRERTGFRTIEVRGTDFYLNGQKIYLKGANRYDEYAPYGNCPPEDVVREDLLKMKQCGLNLVRTHYPQDEMHYRIADEVGIMYMIEVPLNWWYPTADMPFSNFYGLAAEAVDCLDRTFRYFANHPCWTVWSVGNECHHSYPACQEMFRMLAQRMRALNPRRLITYAANKPLRDSRELDFCDFLSLNKYTGCLSDNVGQFAEQLDEPLGEKLNEALRLYPNVPHVMTEFGIVTVRGVSGSPCEGRFNENFGASFLKAQLGVFMKDPLMRGMIIWSWADYRHRHGFYGGGMHLSATYGPYGIVTMDRKVKDPIWDVMQDFYTNWNP